MATVRVSNANLGGLSGDMAKIAPTLVRKGNGIVRRTVRNGEKTAQRINRSASGIHGSNAWKRIDSEMTGPLSGEFGFNGDAHRIVGSGWRHGSGNTDLEKTQDVIGPKFAAEVSKTLDGLFWP